MIKLTLYKNRDPTQSLIISSHTLYDLMRQLMTWMDENSSEVIPERTCLVDGLTVDGGQGHDDDFVDTRCVVLCWDVNQEQWDVDVDGEHCYYGTWHAARQGFIYWGVLLHAVRVSTGLVHACGIFEPYPAVEEIDRAYMDLFGRSLCGIVE